MTYNIIGVMSGTSRDGIDLAYVQFDFKAQKWSFRFIKTETLAYSKAWEKRLGEADQFDTEQIKSLDKEYTIHLAGKINSFIAKNHIVKIDAVCSHGHTIFHQPDKNYTLQIGNFPEISDLVNQKVICDFRTQDVQLGGQGAPLVPIGDRLLFSDYDACINLGGFANISLEQNNTRIAYDICAVNTVLNFYANTLGFSYDDKGQLAQDGKISGALLNQLNALPFYKEKPPKSLGIEWIKAVVIPLIESSSLSAKDILATYTEHIAQQLVKALPSSGKPKILITGGGAYNDFLINRLKNLTPCSIIVPDKTLVDYKEALIFGLLGILKMRGEVNVLKSVTGAPRNHCAGFIYEPTNF